MRRSSALTLALILALTPRPGRAGIANSPHDLVGQGYDVDRAGGSQERCTVCHAAARGGLRDLVHEVPPSLGGHYGAASLVCFSCHDGITLALPEVDASLTAFHPASHGHHLTAHPALREGEIDLPGLTGEHMECTTCHDPHDDSRRPFLRATLGELCLICHSPLAETPVEGVRSAGNHPLGRDPAEVVRSAMPIDVAGAFRVAFPAPYPLQKGKGSVGTHWDLGGHLLGGGAGALECVTCHVVHGDEAAAPLPRLLAANPVNDVANRFCEGCHRGQSGGGGEHGSAAPAAPNPGGTRAARTYHPCDDDTANGEGRIVEVTVPEGWPLGGGAPARLLCDTCHRAHGAEPGTQLLRPPVAAATFCEECHDQMLLEHHHPTADEGGACSDSRSAAAGGVLSFACGLCHRAHNAGLGAADERDFTPILRESRRTDDLCRRCHDPENPTCGTKPDHRSSHFLGDPGLRDTYSDQDPPLRTDPWPESGLVSLYGGPENRVVLCLSCHAFRGGAVTSGDAAGSGHLLARAGNPVDWKEGEEERYLCTGCHGVRPGTGSGSKGHTHPLMEADVAALGLPVRPPASATTDGRMNCDSCHRPHEAVTAAGVYIMEAARGANTDPMAIQPKIDFTPTCHLCHDANKY